MGSLIGQMVVYGLVAAISPVAIMVLVTIMLTKKPMRSALTFLAGYTTFLVALGVIAVFVLHLGTSKGNHAVDGWIDLGLGIVCLVLLALNLRKKEKPQRQWTKPLTAPRAFGIGVVTMMINASTIVAFLAGAHAISAARVSAAQDAIALAVLIAVTLVTLIIPIAIHAVFPKKADKLLASLRTWLTRHQRLIGILILAVFGIYLLVKGIYTLV